MAVVNGPSPFPKVTVGKPTKIGSITTATDVLQFGLSEQSFYHCGSLIVQPVPIGGTATTLTASLAISLDGGTTFNTQTHIGPATVASDTAAMNLIAASTPILASIAIPGIGGQISLQLQTSALTLGTASRVDIWALVA